MTITTTNPSTGEKLSSYPELTDSEIQTNIEFADQVFKDWKQKSFKERGNLFRKLADIYRRDKIELATSMANEMGKPITSGISEVEKCALTMDFYADKTEEFLKNEIVKTEASESFVTFEPLGIVFAVMPWNFPFWQVVRFATPALMAGNVGILKHASNVSGTALMIEKKFIEAGFPEGVFQTFIVSAKRVENIIRNKKVQAITLTGSENAGIEVGRQAGEEIKKVVLELGSNDPFIVLDDADIPMACEDGIWARLQNTGQSCIASKRFIVVESKYDEFVNKYKELWESVKVGNPLDVDTQVGPVYSEKGLLEIERQITESIKHGASVLTGGHRIGNAGAFLQPTILINVKKGMPAYDEEIFGPVASIIKVKDEEEAILVANDSHYGLGASLWTRDMEKAKRIIPKLEFGSVFVNTIVKSDPRLPFGGVKKSGHGRELSHYGIKEFTNIKTVWIR